MRILYYLPILPPTYPEAEALSQEVGALSKRFDGQLSYINPNRHFPFYIPRILFGIHMLRRIRARETAFSAHHLYNPDPFPYPMVKALRLPVVYSISSPVGSSSPNLSYFRSLAAITVYDRRSLERARGWGLENCHLVQPGVDVSRFTHSRLDIDGEIRLLVASSPWTRAQFRSKGVDVLLEAAAKLRQLRLVFLWRGVLFDEMCQRVKDLDLGTQVRVINEPVDVNGILADVHASIVLVDDARIIKSHPHSLLDSLAAGKPVLVSRRIPMSEYVAEKGCGIVVKELEVEQVENAIADLDENYVTLRKTAEEVGQIDFTRQAMLDSFGRVYRSVTGEA